MPEATLQDLRLLLACLVLEHGPGLTRDSLTQTCQQLARTSSSASSWTSSMEPLGSPEARVPLLEQPGGGSGRNWEEGVPQPRSTVPLPLLQLEAAADLGTAGHPGGMTTAASAGPVQNAADHRQAPAEPTELNVGTAFFRAGPRAQELTALPSHWQPQTDTATAQQLEAAPYADRLEWLPYGLPSSTWRQAPGPLSPAQLPFLAHAPVGFPVSLAEASAPPQQAVGYPAAFVGQPPGPLEHGLPAHIGLPASPALPRVAHSAALPPGHEDSRSSPVAAPATQRIQAEKQSDPDGGSPESVVSALTEAGQQVEVLKQRHARRHSSGAGDPALGELIARAEQLHRDMDRALQAHGQLRQERVAAAVKGRRDAASSPTSRSCEHPFLHLAHDGTQRLDAPSVTLADTATHLRCNSNCRCKAYLRDLAGLTGDANLRNLPTSICPCDCLLERRACELHWPERSREGEWRGVERCRQSLSACQGTG